MLLSTFLRCKLIYYQASISEQQGLDRSGTRAFNFFSLVLDSGISSSFLTIDLATAEDAGNTSGKSWISQMRICGEAVFSNVL